jgi:L-ascorbate metabolism protein UlaG (beta-lactamase superfamily)
MKITHFGHACVVVETGGSRLLIDPGSLSDPEDPGDIDAMLFTHSHVDHLDPATVSHIYSSRAPKTVVADRDSRQILNVIGITDVSTADSADGVRLDVAGVRVAATTVAHATIHCDLPHPVNNAYVIDDRLLHPGDAFWVPPQPVDVLLLPIGGPWMKLGEAVDYLRAVAPKVAIPIHQGGLSAPHRGLHGDVLCKLAPSGTEMLELPHGEPVSL